MGTGIFVVVCSKTGERGAIYAEAVSRELKC